MILKELIIKPYDSNRWIVHVGDNSGKNIIVNDSSLNLLRTLQSSKDIESALDQYNERYSASISKEEYQKTIIKFSGLGLFENINHETKKNQYLNFRCQFLNPQAVSKISKPVTFLYQQNIFWPALIILAVINVLFAVHFYSSESNVKLSFENYLFISFLFLLSSILHEIGHTSSCLNSNIKPGGIGFGFYFIFPVFYADITNIWLGTKQQRLITNLSGIYNELIFSICLNLLYPLFGSEKSVLVANLIFIKAVSEINPFVRMDGYWVLSDLTNTPNLLEKANRSFQIGMAKIVRGNEPRFLPNKKEFFLFFYGTMNLLVFFWYFFFIIIKYHLKVLSFPNMVLTLLTKIFNGEITMSDIDVDFLLIFIFYIIVIRTSLKFFKRKLKKGGIRLTEKVPEN